MNIGLLGTETHPFYLSILHGNYAEPGRSSTFVEDARSMLARLTQNEIDDLLAVPEWRLRITGAWFCGMKVWTSYAASLGALLLASEATYEGQGYCFALARFASEDSIHFLTEYLGVYLRLPEKSYDQGWALGALSWVDRMRGTNSASRFLEPGGLWDSFQAGKSRSWSSEKRRMRFAQLMEFTAAAFDA